MRWKVDYRTDAVRTLETHRETEEEDVVGLHKTCKSRN